MTGTHFRSTFKAIAILAAVSVSSTAATATTYNYNQYVTGLNLGAVTLAVLEANQNGADVDFTLTNTGAGGSASWIDYLKFNYSQSVGSLNLVDDPDSWTIGVGAANGTDAGFSFDVKADVAPNGSADGLLSGDSTSWSFLGATLADFSFVSPNSLVHIGAVSFNGTGGSTKYFATTGGGGGTGVVPVPAGLPLLLTGLGVFGLLRVRRRKSAEG